MTRFRLTRLLILGLVLATLLSACATTADQTLELTQSISGELFGGTVELRYPDGWAAAVAEGVIRLSNQESFVSEGIGVRRSGDMAGGAMPLLKDALFAYNLDSDASMTEIARALGAAYAADMPNLVMSSPTTFLVDERRGAIVPGTAQGTGDSVGRVAIAVIDLGDAVGVVTIAVFGENVIPANYARAIAETFTFRPG